jgi:transcription elongation factor GreB
MSKAFTKETDAPDVEVEVADALPAGARNYITAQGLRRLHQELKQLRSVERPKVVEIVSWAAGNGDRSENGDYIYGKKRLREIDRRMRHLMKRIDIAEVVDPRLQRNHDKVFFGATVYYRNSRQEAHTVRIVGIDEVRHEKGEISWVAPIARALMKAEEGDIVQLRVPGGNEALEVIEIRYFDAETI